MIPRNANDTIAPLAFTPLCQAYGSEARWIKKCWWKIWKSKFVFKNIKVGKKREKNKAMNKLGKYVTFAFKITCFNFILISKCCKWKQFEKRIKKIQTLLSEILHLIFLTDLYALNSVCLNQAVSDFVTLHTILKICKNRFWDCPMSGLCLTCTWILVNSWIWTTVWLHFKTDAVHTTIISRNFGPVLYFCATSCGRALFQVNFMWGKWKCSSTKNENGILTA